MTGDRFAHTVAETEAWLDEVQRAAGFAHERQAYAALRAVLHTVRDHLAIADAARFAAQLPTLLRGLFFDGWHPGGGPDSPSRNTFLDTVRDRLAGQPDVAPDHAVRAVLAVVGGRLGQKAVEELGIPPPKDLLHL
jgi:uncharacterized protein (DUF2267 family)